jgi:hypothetical protein
MTQSNIIAGALVGGFIVFITVRGELPDYIGLFTKKRTSTKGGKKGSFFGLDIPGLSKKDEKNAEDEGIDAVGTAIGGDYYRIADKFI